MIDFHCHLDLYKNSLSILDEVEDRCICVLAVTTSPRAWQITSKYFAERQGILVGLGMHPEILTEKIDERELFLSSVPQCIYVGEIGLDGVSRNRKSLSLQEDFFREAIKVSEKCGGKLLSIHSRGAAKETLEIIEQNINKSKPVLHWFTGTVKQLEWAISLNCWFSINPLMFTNSKGLTLVQKIPLSRIFPETDGPFTVYRGTPYLPWDTNSVIDCLANIHKKSRQEIEYILLNNLNRIGIKGKCRDQF